MGKGAFTGLIHCFTGTPKLADAALELGLYISVSGIATFKNSATLRDVIKTVPLERLLVETDAPFLAPVPHRGKTNEPAFVVHTARMLAELKGVPPDELAARPRTISSVCSPRLSRPHDDWNCASWAAVLPAECRAWAGDGAATGAPAILKIRKPASPMLHPGYAMAGAGETRVLVDTSPDLREQLLAANIGRLDAV